MRVSTQQNMENHLTLVSITYEFYKSNIITYPRHAGRIPKCLLSSHKQDPP